MIIIALFAFETAIKAVLKSIINSIKTFVMEQKHTDREEYLKLFCENQRVSRRSVIYLSKETHRKLSSLAYLFYEEGVCMASLADNIIRLHIEAHIELLKKEAKLKNINSSSLFDK